MPGDEVGHACWVHAYEGREVDVLGETAELWWWRQHGHSRGTPAYTHTHGRRLHRRQPGKARHGVHARQREAWQCRCTSAFVLVDQSFRLVFFLQSFVLAVLPLRSAPAVCTLRLGGSLPDVISVIKAHRVARSRSSPESRDAVVCTTRKDVAKRVPRKTPHRTRRLVGIGDGMGWMDGLRGRVLRVRSVVGRDCGGLALGRVLLIEEVVVDSALVAACGKEVLVYRMPG
jgi:hypothetical protein